jgi:predicted MFS family arabinose efflux permease
MPPKLDHTEHMPPTQHPQQAQQHVFTPYQKFVIAMLAFLQFTIVLDFMIMGPLGALLMRDMHISPSQFGRVVSVYALAAAISGLTTAGFADKFDRKKLLLFFYCGFLAGTLLCGLAGTYNLLLFARIVTGLFGGVVGSISMAIIADRFPLQVRGRVMGVVQTSFAASQVMGIPLGVFLSNHWGWHAPFLMIVAVSAAVGVVIVAKLQPIDAHLKAPARGNAFLHLFKTVFRLRYLQTFAATMLLATGGFMLMPFGSAFAVNNLGISLQKLPWVYMATGVVAFGAGPLMGRLSDTIGKYVTFCIGSVIALVIVGIYCNLGVTPLGLVILINALLFIGITGRIVSAMALTSAVPDMQDRGAFMSVNSAVQQLSGAAAAWVAGLIVVQRPDGQLARYDVLGYVVMSAIALTLALMYPIHRMVMRKAAGAPAPQPFVPHGPPPASAPAEPVLAAVVPAVPPPPESA